MAAEETTWTPLPPPTVRQRLMMGLTIQWFWALLGMNLTSIAGIFFWEDDKWLRVALALAAFLVAVVLIALLSYRVTPPVLVDPDTCRVCLKRRPVGFEDVTTARVAAWGSPRNRSVLLTLGTSGRRSGVVMVRNRLGSSLDEKARTALLALLHASTIATPVSPDDPTGTFAHVNFPGHLSKADAITLVATNPLSDAPIPGLSRWR